MDYQQQALDFAKNTNLTLTSRYIGHMKYFDNDKQERAVFECTLKNDRHSYTFRFGQSITDSYSIKEGFSHKELSMSNLSFNLDPYFKDALVRNVRQYINGKEYRISLKKSEPTMYDILACMEKYEVGTHEDFCNNFGYDIDSISHREIYFKVQEEYNNVCKLFTSDEIELLLEIN